MMNRFIERLSALSLVQKLIAVFAAGLVMVPAMPPYGLWPLLGVGFGVFYIVLASLSGWRAALAGWAFGFGYFLYGLYWIANALLVPDNEYVWLYPFAVAGLPALLACFTAAGAWAVRRYAGDLRQWQGMILFVCIFTITELARGHLFTGFPWNSYGYTWAALLPVAQLASVGGIYLLSMVTIFWAVLPAYAVMARSARLLMTGLVLFGVVLAGGIVRMDSHPTRLRDDIVVRPVQPNIAQEDKWHPRKMFQNFEKHLLLSEAPKDGGDKTTILIWSETALPHAIMNDSDAQAMMRLVLGDYQVPVYLVTGVLRQDPLRPAAHQRADYYNSLAVLNRDAELLGVYDKAHLVPFGEYVPLQKFIPFGPIANIAGFTAGDGPRTMNIHALPPFSPLICYEIIFSGGAIDRSAQKRPEWLLNITNDAWYGDSMGPRQHFTMTIFRAIEQGLPAVRAANTGISGVIDPVGRVIHQSPLLTVDNTDIPLPYPIISTSLYGEYGNMVVVTVLLALLALAVYGLRKHEI